MHIGRWFGIAGAALLASTSPSPMQAQFGGLLGGSISMAGGVALPLGDLDKEAVTGFSFAMRSERSLGSGGWGLRGGVSFDRFGGKGDIAHHQYLGFATELGHRSGPKFNQYFGFGLYTARVVAREGSPSQSNRSGFNFGFQGGVGVGLTKGGRLFTDFGLVHVFTDEGTASWFPVRIGFRI